MHYRAVSQWLLWRGWYCPVNGLDCANRMDLNKSRAGITWVAIILDVIYKARTHRSLVAGAADGYRCRACDWGDVFISMKSAWPTLGCDPVAGALRTPGRRIPTSYSFLRYFLLHLIVCEQIWRDDCAIRRLTTTKFRGKTRRMSREEFRKLGQIYCLACKRKQDMCWALQNVLINISFFMEKVVCPEIIVCRFGKYDTLVSKWPSIHVLTMVVNIRVVVLFDKN